MTIDLSQVQFGVEPPEAKSGSTFSSKYSELIAAIKTHAEAAESNPDLSEWVQLPGKWPVSAAGNWNRGIISGIEPGEVEAVVRDIAEVDDFARTPQGSYKLDEFGERIPKKRRLGDLYLRYLGQQGIALKQDLSEGELSSLSAFLDDN